MPCFDRMHSFVVRNGRIVFNAISIENQNFEFEITGPMAAMMYSAIQSASKDLPENPIQRAIIPVGIQTAIVPGMDPGLVIRLADNLELVLALPGDKLAQLKSAIGALEASTKAGDARH